jgi:hypothetical protein
MSTTTQTGEGISLFKDQDCVPALKDEPDYRGTSATTRPSRAAQARRELGRRRGIDSTACERDYAAAEVEFMNAIQEYKVASGRMFPTWSEVLAVLKGLEYAKELLGAASSPMAP